MVKKIEYDETRQMIAEFSKAFNRPINMTPTRPSVTDRLLLGKLLLEETLEYIEKGLGLRLHTHQDGVSMLVPASTIQLHHHEGDCYDVIEAADGLGDINVVIHFNALWEGIPLSEVTNEIHRSNMSKLGPNGKPIINGVTPGYRDNWEMEAYDGSTYSETGYDPSKPKGKILKGPNYSPPNLLPILGVVPHEEEE